MSTNLITVVLVLPEERQCLDAVVGDSSCITVIVRDLQSLGGTSPRMFVVSPPYPTINDGSRGIESGIPAFDPALIAADETSRGILFVDARAHVDQHEIVSICDSGDRAKMPVSAILPGEFQNERNLLCTYVSSSVILREPDPEALLWRLAQEFVRATPGDETDDRISVICEAGNALFVRGLGDVAALEAKLMQSRAAAAMKSGVRLIDPRTTYIRGELSCGQDVTIYPCVVIEGQVTIGDRVTIGANCILRNCTIESDVRINPYSLVEDSVVGCRSFIGPYGRLRPGSRVGAEVQIGNYVEIKNSSIGDGCRINHHTFIGDAVLAEKVTIGAGTITCNHDGAGPQPTRIERDAYVGSGCNLVAPINVGQGAVIGAGSTVTRDVPPGKLTVARQTQITVEGWKGPRSNRKNK